MLILAFVTISSINGFGLFSKANQVKNMYDNSYEEDEISSVTGALHNYLHVDTNGTTTEDSTIEGISIASYDDLTIVAGNKGTPRLLLEYSSDVKVNITYLSGNTSIATINSVTGEVTGKSAGTATMTVTIISNNSIKETATCTVTVQTAVAQVGTGATAVYYASLQSAIDAVPTTNEETAVTLLTDTTECAMVKTNQNVYLNLNGKTLTGATISGYNMVMGDDEMNCDGLEVALITLANATLTLSNGTIESVLVINNGTFTMIDGTIESAVYNIGTFTMIDGTITSGSNNNEPVLDYGTFTMTGGTISEVGGDGGVAVFVYTHGAFIMTGGTISAVGGNNIRGVRYYSDGEMCITGGTISASANGGSCEGVFIFSTTNDAKITITGVTIEVNSGFAVYSLDNIIISNVTINAGSGSVVSTNEEAVLYNCTITGTIGSCFGQVVNITTTPGTGYKIEYYEGNISTTSVQFQTWCDADKAGTMYNYSSTKQTTANGTAWVCTVNKSNHQNKTGAYTTDVYVTTGSGTSMVMDISGIINI